MHKTTGRSFDNKAADSLRPGIYFLKGIFYNSTVIDRLLLGAAGHPEKIMTEVENYAAI